MQCILRLAGVSHVNATTLGPPKNAFHLVFALFLVLLHHTPRAVDVLDATRLPLVKHLRSGQEQT